MENRLDWLKTNAVILSDHLADAAQHGLSWVKENKAKTAVGLSALTTCYLLLVRFYRYRHINAIRRKYPDQDIVLKDPAIAEEIYDMTIRKDFPFLARQSLELALFKTYTVPTISKLLCATGEFEKGKTAKRVEDTELILLEISDAYPHIEEEKRTNRNASEEEIVSRQRHRASQALTRLNEIHGKYNILNGDFLYTLSLFILEPIRWINKYEWRQLDQREKNAIFRVWYDIGIGMNIKDIPDTLEKMQEFHESYAKEHVRYAETNWKVGQPTVEHLLTRVPKFIRPLAYKVLYKVLPCILDPRDVAGFGLPPASPTLKKWVDRLLYLRAFILRHAALPRWKSKVRTPLKPNSKGLYEPRFNLYEPVYPNGYCIFELGPEKYRPAKCPIAHN